MNTGDDGKAVMHYFESCKLKAYPDPASPLFAALKAGGVNPYNLDSVPGAFAHLSGAPWTIGLGDTGPDVVPGLVITQAEADERFAKRLAVEFEPGVDAAVKPPATQHEFDAMVALAYNIGLGNFKTSSVLRKHNAQDKLGAADAFRLWNKAAGKVMKGLQRRREAERAVYLGLDGHDAIAAALRAFP